MRRNPATVALCLMVLTLASAPAWAGRKTIDVDPWSTVIQGNISKNLESSDDGGLLLGASGTSTFGFSFQLPRRYRSNSPIEIVFRWHSFGTNCDVLIEPSVLVRARVGSVTPNIDPMDGLEAEDGSDLWATAGTSDVGLEKTYLLTPSSSFSQMAGDDLMIAFTRDADDASDTCASQMLITGISVTYRTR